MKENNLIKCKMCEEYNGTLTYPINENQKIKVCITCFCILAEKEKDHGKPKIMVKRR